jgi:hypothetical protein
MTLGLIVRNKPQVLCTKKRGSHETPSSGGNVNLNVELQTGAN